MWKVWKSKIVGPVPTWGWQKNCARFYAKCRPREHTYGFNKSPINFCSKRAISEMGKKELSNSERRFLKVQTLGENNCIICWGIIITTWSSWPMEGLQSVIRELWLESVVCIFSQIEASVNRNMIWNIEGWVLNLDRTRFLNVTPGKFSSFWKYSINRSVQCVRDGVCSQLNQEVEFKIVHKYLYDNRIVFYTKIYR